VGDASRAAGKDIREEAGAVDRAPSREVAALRLEPGAGTVSNEPLYRPLEADFGAGGSSPILQDAAHTREIDEPSIGHLKRRNSAGMGFESPDAVAV
jgi:hypothetical protein